MDGGTRVRRTTMLVPSQPRSTKLMNWKLYDMSGYLAARYGRAFRLEQGRGGPQSHSTVSLRGRRLTPYVRNGRNIRLAT